MVINIEDSAFGKMEYKHRWYKKEKFSFWGKSWNITVAAKAYSGKAITEQQRNSYSWIKQNFSDIEEKMAGMLINYINKNYMELADEWFGARRVSISADLSAIVTPKTLLIKQDGMTVFLFECPWSESGIGIQVLPEFQIGSQEIFL